MWKDVVNRALRTTTGYELRREGSTEAAGPAEPATTNPRVQGRRRRRRAQRIPHHVDDLAAETMRQVRPRTMTSWTKLHALVLATRYVVRHEIPGDIVECGVWRGGSMQAVARTLQELGAADRHLHLFDTFEGMPPATEEDRRARDGAAAADLLAAHDQDHTIWAHAGLQEVQEAMREVDYPADLVSYHVGMVEDTIPGKAPDRIAILRLDTDWYASTKHELDHLWDRLVPGGVLIIDDYGHWEGSQRATEEFLERTGARLLLVPIDDGRIAVKAGS